MLIRCCLLTAKESCTASILVIQLKAIWEHGSFKNLGILFMIRRVTDLGIEPGWLLWISVKVICRWFWQFKSIKARMGLTEGNLLLSFWAVLNKIISKTDNFSPLVPYLLLPCLFLHPIQILFIWAFLRTHLWYSLPWNTIVQITADIVLLLLLHRN